MKWFTDTFCFNWVREILLTFNVLTDGYLNAFHIFWPVRLICSAKKNQKKHDSQADEQPQILLEHELILFLDHVRYTRQA